MRVCFSFAGGGRGAVWTDVPVVPRIGETVAVPLPSDGDTASDREPLVSRVADLGRSGGRDGQLGDVLTSAEIETIIDLFGAARVASPSSGRLRLERVVDVRHFALTEPPEVHVVVTNGG